MKKFLLVASCALLVLPFITSCNSSPTGDPKADAEAFQKVIEQQLDIELEARQKVVDLAEYYAENEEYDAYEDLQNEFLEMTSDLQEKYEDQLKDLEKALQKAEKKIYKKKKTKSDDEQSNEDDEE